MNTVDIKQTAPLEVNKFNGSPNSDNHFANLIFLYVIDYPITVVLTSEHYSMAGTNKEMTKEHLKLSRVWIVQKFRPLILHQYP